LKFKFSRPSRVDLIGSYLVRTVTKPLLNIDIAIEIPKSCLNEKDYLDYRYIDKRALYLRTIQQALASHHDFANMSVRTFRGDPLKPILCISPPKPSVPSSSSSNGKGQKRKASDDSDGAASGISSKFIIRIIPCIAETAFPLQKLAPNRACIKGLTAGDDDDSDDEEVKAPAKKGKGGAAAAAAVTDEKKKPSIASPLYNQRIIEDMMYRRHFDEIHAITQSSPSFVDTIVMFKVMHCSFTFTLIPLSQVW
jgi:U3 small nucleolar RNA-associated protein 22